MSALITIPLQDWQQEILNCKSKVRTIVACRRAGKSVTLAADMLNSAINIPGGNSLLVNPVQSQSNTFFKQLIEPIPNMDRCYAKLSKGRENPKVSPHPTIVFKGGHTLQMKTWKSSGSNVGGHLDRLYLDESADFDGDEVFKSLSPKLSDRRGLMLVAGTVTTETSFIWQMYLRGLGKDKRFASWRKTWKDALIYQGKSGEAELQFLYDTMSDLDFKTQIEVLPVGDNSTAFPKLSNCLCDIEPPPCPQSGRKYCMTADLARSSDYTYVTIIDDTGLVVFEEQMIKNLDYAVYAKQCADIAIRWRVGDSFTFDDTGCGGSGGLRTTERSVSKFYKEAYPQARPWIWSGNSEHKSKHEVVQHFNCLTQEKRQFLGSDGVLTTLPKLRIPRKFTRLINQLQDYKCVVNKTTQKLEYRGKFNKDDGASALILACWRAFKDNLYGPVIGQKAVYVNSNHIEKFD